jgi:hypothetical protein
MCCRTGVLAAIVQLSVAACSAPLITGRTTYMFVLLCVTPVSVKSVVLVMTLVFRFTSAPPLVLR